MMTTTVHTIRAMKYRAAIGHKVLLRLGRRERDSKIINLCNFCHVEVTEADIEAGKCTNCGLAVGFHPAKLPLNRCNFW